MVMYGCGLFGRKGRHHVWNEFSEVCVVYRQPLSTKLWSVGVQSLSLINIVCAINCP